MKVDATERKQWSRPPPSPGRLHLLSTRGAPCPRTQVRSRQSYVIVRNHLLDLVRNGLANGSPVPSERELCEQFEVSRMTVRQAIDTLVVDGILERHQGKGTFVAPPKLDLQVRLTSFTQEMHVAEWSPAWSCS